MKKKTFPILLLIFLLAIGCSKKSPIEKVTKVFEKVKSETIFNLVEVEQKQIKGLNILDFGIEFPEEKHAAFFAKSSVISGEKQQVEIGSSSNIPFAVFVNGKKQFVQPKRRSFEFREIAYDIFNFQDSFNLDFNKGNNEIVIQTLSGERPKIYLKEISPPGKELKLKFGKWVFSKSLRNNFTKTLDLSDLNWQNKKLVMQHSIETPKVRTYPREANNEWTYSNGAAILGLMNIYNYNNDESLYNYVKQFCDFTLTNYDLLRKDYFDNNSLRCADYRMFRKAMLDDTGAPTLPLILIYQKTKDEKYIPLINEMAEYVSHGQARLSDGTLCRPEPVEMTVWADDMFMSAPMLLRVALINDDKSMADDAVKQILNIHNYLWDEKAELHKHAWFDDVKEQSQIFWSRANGWIIWAVTDALQFLPKESESYNKVMKIYNKIIRGIIKYQDTDGIWHQVLNNPTSFGETSGSAMFTMAIAAGVNNGWLDNSYKDHALKGWKAISRKISNDGIVKDICRGTGIGYDEEFYMKRKRFPNDPRGLGALFTCAVEVEKLMKDQ
ncbi:hypothetical protein MNBD_IGNAVI01-320 [hydrothermal vent metagenome]|uniref:Rhamnogalacturonides degradation protein RhiN n=1 Tax=hydrothermal vent metagenome TaxID=652676 RepID=A0A3B1CFE0_9ZZZZ